MLTYKKEKGGVVAVTILLCYAQEDEGMKDALKKHLKLLERKGLISTWDDGDIRSGTEWEQEMKKHLDEAQMILLLISADFIASDYCYLTQMQHAIERHESKEARVIPILLHSVYWEEPPLDKLQVLPHEKKPISKWTPSADGFENAVVAIAQIVKQWNEHTLPDPMPERKAMMAHLDQMIATVKLQLQPPGRADATTKTLQELSIFIPNDVTLADLMIGWRTLSRSTQNEEDIATERRRITCGELADIAAQFTTGQGNMEQAIKTWQIWRDAFQKSDDARQATMAKTFGREARELQDASLTR